ncbi:glycoside hydrolase family 55 protein [Saccharata proteae CBS 121410]|uniref:Glycoside hydrolase family 55 protein n=1 Tax=Saccharata proteae CBS 121410 TaxID=1314787 RepID=A0A9P4HS29_9PEZI|nr:glycoside hydrolase family 55 protein [Saccharata proteae CBS 121410]
MDYSLLLPNSRSAHTSRDSCTSLTKDSPSTFWYGKIDHNGESSFLSSKDEYTVFRNVVSDFGADNTGASDAASAINSAILAGPTNGADRSAHSYGTTGQPAVVYLPAGTYLLESALELYVGTVLVGDALNPPTLKASSGFSPEYMIYGKDSNLGGTDVFYVAIKNIILDSTNVDGATDITLLDWTVSQATQLTNVVFNMPDDSTGHTGMTAGLWSGDAGYNSNIIINDISFKGGKIGMNLSGQQWVFKGISFSGCTTGAAISGNDIIFTNSSWSNCGTGITADGISGSLIVLDSSTSAIGNFINSANLYSPNGIVLENVDHSGGDTVNLDGSTVLTGSVSDTWYRGNAYDSGSSTHVWTGDYSGTTSSTPRTSALTASSGQYFAMAPPTYSEYSADQVINIKSVTAYPVKGDGSTDDAANINSILSMYAGCKIIYFPAGTYIVSETILVPEGSRIFGDAFASAISADGSNFYNPDSPVPMVQVGKAGSEGVAQISDMIFTVADVLQGCKLLEVNMAGTSPGDVGVWNSHFRVGGAVGSLVQTNCDSTPDACKAAWGLLHLTDTSSAYIENMWGWTADHDLDGNYEQTISVGRGALIEATKGTWLVGTGMEHNTLYQYNFYGAQNVYTALQQSETPYWQGSSSTTAPYPWSSDLIASDPTFSSCSTSSPKCGMAWFELIDSSSSDLFLYGGCLWAYFDGGVNDACDGDCQTNAVSIDKATGVYVYGLNVKSVTDMVLSDEGANTVSMEDNSGGWGGVVAAYLFNS